jgi:hypothetical protein|tara:strand:- start:160 stop:339 length:180 start_codon:yes stop_codon:yes gene_type:complete
MAKNKQGKEQGADGKACWEGYTHKGTVNGKDKCVETPKKNRLGGFVIEPRSIVDLDELV